MNLKDVVGLLKLVQTLNGFIKEHFDALLFLSQTTDVRLLQIEKVCKRQFQI